MRHLPFASLVFFALGCASTQNEPAPLPAPEPPAIVVQQPQQSSRPLPHPPDVAPEYAHAVGNGTRTTRGEPGPRYWQQFATYQLTARLDPANRRVAGTAIIQYRNNSPDTLDNLHLDLTQNFHRPGAQRNEEVEVTDGIELKRVAVNQRELTTEGEGPRYEEFGTRLIILPHEPVAPQTSVEIAIDWEFTVPQAGAGERMGWDSGNLFFLAYWYPQMVVYDDVIGWHPDPFVGTTEFYAGFANYDLTVDVPDGWVVMGTGRLTNAQEVLAPKIYERLQRAEASDEVVNVLTAADLGTAGTAKGANGRLRWHFTADSVRDVAFSATFASLWDAARTSVGDRNRDGQTDYTRVDAFYRQSAPLWKESARYSQHAIRFLSQHLGQPYPWPHMSAVEASNIIDGGMEYPMMTLIGDYTEAGDTALYAVTSHEEGHMWFPMLVASDERRYSWYDEGTNTYNENQAKKDRYPGRNFEAEEAEGYLEIANSGLEGEITRWSAFHYSPYAYGIASYSKPGSVLTALRGVLGDSVFNKALRQHVQQWKYKHPYPWDLWNTFESVSGRDLDWFWYSWYQTTWVLDQAVSAVSASNNSVTITVDDRGRIPMPVLLAITLENGQVIRREVPVETWLRGETRTTLTVPVTSPVVTVVIDPEQLFPDVQRSNGVWRR